MQASHQNMYTFIFHLSSGISLPQPCLVKRHVICLWVSFKQTCIKDLNKTYIIKRLLYLWWKILKKSNVIFKFILQIGKTIKNKHCQIVGLTSLLLKHKTTASFEFLVMSFRSTNLFLPCQQASTSNYCHCKGCALNQQIILCITSKGTDHITNLLSTNLSMVLQCMTCPTIFYWTGGKKVYIHTFS